jgi:hypothetical protein
MSESSFNFNGFLKETKDVLVNPKSYFSTMKTTGGLGEPVIKALIYGTLAGIIGYIWYLLHFGGGMIGGAVGIMIIIWAIVGAVIGLFLGAVVTLIVSAICKGSTDYEANARLTAALMAIMPISALFGFLDKLSPVAGTIVSLAISLYSLYMLYHGLIEALKAKPGTVKIVMIVLAAIVALIMLLGIGAKKRANQLMDEFNKSDFKELMEDVQK